MLRDNIYYSQRPLYQLFDRLTWSRCRNYQHVQKKAILIIYLWISKHILQRAAWALCCSSDEYFSFSWSTRLVLVSTQALSKGRKRKRKKMTLAGLFGYSREFIWGLTSGILLVNCLVGLLVLFVWLMVGLLLVRLSSVVKDKRNWSDFQTTDTVLYSIGYLDQSENYFGRSRYGRHFWWSKCDIW